MRPTRLIAALALAAAAAAAQASVVTTGGNLLLNGDFEQSNVAVNGYNYISYAATSAVAAPGWTFAGGSGIANRSAAWGGAATGSAVAFLQSYPGFDPSVLSQGFSSTGSVFTITFSAAQRPGNQESLRVLFDGVDLSPLLLTPAGAGWTSYTLSTTSVGARSHTLSFVGVNTSSASDSSLFLDNISVTADATVPEPGSLALVGAALAGLGFVRRRLRGYAS